MWQMMNHVLEVVKGVKSVWLKNISDSDNARLKIVFCASCECGVCINVSIKADLQQNKWAFLRGWTQLFCWNVDISASVRRRLQKVILTTGKYISTYYFISESLVENSGNKNCDFSEFRKNGKSKNLVSFDYATIIHY